MPNPNDYEDKDKFMEACVSARVDEGNEQDQAVAACLNIWRNRGKSTDPDAVITFGGEVKALGDGVVGGYLVRFSDETTPDLEGDFFTAATDFGSALHSDTYYNHGLDSKLGKRMLGTAKLRTDDVGIWTEVQLKLRDKWERAVYALAEKGKLGWSSGTAPHLVERQAKGSAWHITRWPLGLDASLTPTPAEPRNAAMPLKSWADSWTVSDPGLEVMAQEDEAESSSVSTTAGDVVVNITVSHQKAEKTPISTEVLEMSEKEEVKEQPPLDVEAIIAKTADAVAMKTAEAINAEWKKRLEAEPPLKSSGVVITTDAAENKLKADPFKSLSEFLLSVKDFAGGSRDERLLPLQGRDASTEGGFSLTGALGRKQVGSLYNAAIKAPTGLNEATPSAGGFLVGTDDRRDIMGRVYETGSLLQRVAMFPVSANSNGMTFLQEAETSRTAGNRRGGVRAYWTEEAGEKIASQPEFQKLELKLRKVVGLVYCTDELLADAATLEAYILRVLPEELRFVVEDSLVNGTGAGQPLGLLAGGGLVSVAKETGQAATTIVYENLVKMWARMWAPSRRNAVWLINQDCEPQLHFLQLPVGTGGMPVYLPPGGASASPYSTIFGRPVLPVEYCATLGTVGDIILCDLGEYYAIEKGGVESASSIHVRFVYDETVWRFVYRFDGEPSWSSALTPFKGSNTLSPYVVLATRS